MLSMLLALSQYADMVLKHLTAAATMRDGQHWIAGERSASLVLLTVGWFLLSYMRV